MSVPQHDQLILLGDFNAVSGVNRVGFEQVIGNHGSGTPNDNTFQLLTFCAAHGLSILGSWFQRRKIHRSTWISNDHRTKKEIYHIITRDRNAFTSCRVYHGAECPANTDHRLLAAKMKLSWRPAVRFRQQQPKYDTISLLNDSSIADRYTIDVCNRFQALSLDEEDVESQWAAISSASGSLQTQLLAEVNLYASHGYQMGLSTSYNKSSQHGNRMTTRNAIA